MIRMLMSGQIVRVLAGRVGCGTATEAYVFGGGCVGGGATACRTAVLHATLYRLLHRTTSPGAFARRQGSREQACAACVTRRGIVSWTEVSKGQASRKAELWH